MQVQFSDPNCGPSAILPYCTWWNRKKGRLDPTCSLRYDEWKGRTTDPLPSDEPQSLLNKMEAPVLLHFKSIQPSPMSPFKPLFQMTLGPIASGDNVSQQLSSDLLCWWSLLLLLGINIYSSSPESEHRQCGQSCISPPDTEQVTDSTKKEEKSQSNDLCFPYQTLRQQEIGFGFPCNSA